MVIDKLYNRFDALAKKYGNDVVLEFIWVLASLYHDIGYPVVLLQQCLLCEIYGLESEKNLQLTDECSQQIRQNLWNSPDYNFVITVLDNLFSHKINSRTEKWVFDGFSHPTPPTKFKDSMKTSFVEEGAHGVAGALILALLTNSLIKGIKENKDREFLYRHTMLASISILFHDSKVRNCFRANSIKKVKAEDFPFSVLLTYVDILQDDRRDQTSSSSRPDIFKDVKIVNNGIVVADLEKKILEDWVKKKLFEELNEAFSFFIMNGLTFDIPQELL